MNKRGPAYRPNLQFMSSRNYDHGSTAHQGYYQQASRYEGSLSAGYDGVQAGSAPPHGGVIPSAVNTDIQRQCFKTKLCAFFPLNKCQKGSSCPFAHDSTEMRDQPDWRKTKVCLMWKSNTCDKPGDLCNYAHGTQELRRGMNTPTNNSGRDIGSSSKGMRDITRLDASTGQREEKGYQDPVDPLGPVRKIYIDSPKNSGAEKDKLLDDERMYRPYPQVPVIPLIPCDGPSMYMNPPGDSRSPSLYQMKERQHDWIDPDAQFSSSPVVPTNGQMYPGTPVHLMRPRESDFLHTHPPYIFDEHEEVLGFAATNKGENENSSLLSTELPGGAEYHNGFGSPPIGDAYTAAFLNEHKGVDNRWDSPVLIKGMERGDIYGENSSIGDANAYLGYQQSPVYNDAPSSPTVIMEQSEVWLNQMHGSPVMNNAIYTDVYWDYNSPPDYINERRGMRHHVNPAVSPAITHLECDEDGQSKNG